MLPPLCSHPVSFPPGAIYYHHFWRNPKKIHSTQFLSRASRFCLTGFEENHDFFWLYPVSFPNVPIFSYCLWKNRDFFRRYPLSDISAVVIIVHMQKIRNRHSFFKKFLTSGILPKILKAFRLYQVYCQKFWKQYRFFEKICHIGYISRIFENVLTFQNFFQKIFLWHPPADRTSAFQ